MKEDFNEYDIDMDDDEETKADPSVGSVRVPVENISHASKTIVPQQVYPMSYEEQYLGLPQGGHNYGSRRQSESQGGDFFDEMAQKREAYMRKGSIDTHVDISAINDDARRASWNRLMTANLETISVEQFEDNMRRLSDLEHERRSQVSKSSGMSSLKTQTVQKTNITVYIADMDVAEQVKIEQELPLIY